MLPSQGDQIVVRDLVRTAHQIGSEDSIFAAQVIWHEVMARISKERSEDAEGLIRRHAIAKGRMRRHTRKTELGDGTRCEIRDPTQPGARNMMMFMVLPKECHEHIHIEQERHVV
jgi:hypothetical protein